MHSAKSVSRIAIVGDMHMQFDEHDVAFFNGSEYDCILFVGDLASTVPDGMFRLLPFLNSLAKPAYLIPGNHDTTGARALIGEVTRNQFLINFGAGSQPGRFEKLQAGLTGPVLCGYSRHTLNPALDMVAARPFSMGSTNATVNFRPFLEKEYGVGSLGESVQKLKTLIDAANFPYLILAHQGPFGLGRLATDMWGADFLPQETDFGDADLADALAYAQQIKKPPLAVIAGHMHYPTKRGKKPRQWWARKDNILYINAARWPRIFKHGDRTLRHHVRLTIADNDVVQVSACYVDGDSINFTQNDMAMLA
jgi:uncharacterized protein (TIGR04168 family)